MKRLLGKYFRPLHAPQDNPVALKLSAIQHFYDKLLRIKDRLKTDAGKCLGAQRHQMVIVLFLWFACVNYNRFQMIQFLQAVKHEYSVDCGQHSLFDPKLTSAAEDR